MVVGPGSGTGRTGALVPDPDPTAASVPTVGRTVSTCCPPPSRAATRYRARVDAPAYDRRMDSLVFLDLSISDPIVLLMIGVVVVVLAVLLLQLIRPPR